MKEPPISHRHHSSRSSLLLFALLFVLILLANQLWNDQKYWISTISLAHHPVDWTVDDGGEKPNTENDSSSSSESESKVSNNKIIESFVISFDLDRLDRFFRRNNNTGIESIWVPGVDGFHQPNLNLWARLMGNGARPLNASHFIPGLQAHKDIYASPHAVGCYLAHLHLLRMLYHRPEALRPELYAVFEDDTVCIPQTAQRLLETAQTLPPDWDILYLSGKPILRFHEDEEPFNTSWSYEVVEQKVCAGRFGEGTGITNPNGTRHLRHSDNYWRTYYLTKTASYVLNPQRMYRIMEVLEPKNHPWYEPIDIRLADAMKDGRLNAYMTPLQPCSSVKTITDEPIPWNGYWTFWNKTGGWLANHYRTTDVHVFSPNCVI